MIYVFSNDLPKRLACMPSRLSQWHEGEAAMQERLKVPLMENPTAAGLPMSYVWRVADSSLVAVGTLDEQGRPWTTVWGGRIGFAGQVAQDVVGFNTDVDAQYDPVLEAFWEGSPRDGGDVVQPNQGRGKMMSAVAINLTSRDRVKLGGNMVAGARTGADGVQVAMHVTESLGNCPKYINKKIIEPHPVNPKLISDQLPLPAEAVELVGRADVLFLSSSNNEAMDTNIRGGAPGFMRVIKNTEDGVELIFPEFSGNRYYQNVGNLKINPRVGVVIPDFTTSDALYVTGVASILVDDEASSLMARTKLAVKITVTAARYVKSSLPFRGTFVDKSPYTPPVRYLIAEKGPLVAESQSQVIEAKLTGRTSITPSISRFTFGLSSSKGPIPAWEAGQYITFDFAPELDNGYSHMRDDDPQSINDDFVRTFTVSSPPDGKSDIEVTLRRNGPATGLLWRHNLAVPLDVPVLGFGGEESFRLSKSSSPAVFVAGGVGITPVLAQAPAVLASGTSADGGPRLRVLWSLRAEDLPLAVDSFDRIKGLGQVTTIFVSGDIEKDGVADVVEKLRGEGAKVHNRRLGSDDVDGLKKKGNKFYLCTGPAFLKKLEEWLDGEDLVTGEREGVTLYNKLYVTEPKDSQCQAVAPVIQNTLIRLAAAGPALRPQKVLRDNLSSFFHPCHINAKIPPAQPLRRMNSKASSRASMAIGSPITAPSLVYFTTLKALFEVSRNPKGTTGRSHIDTSYEYP
ncbi:hypothetical protein HJFPF1_09055 [Paramyrothecium foliicola]|nr:hypothetical protein HJFPF1_09055 [Paramyrothecium foliicola]